METREKNKTTLEEKINGLFGAENSDLREFERMKDWITER